MAKVLLFVIAGLCIAAVVLSLFAFIITFSATMLVTCFSIAVGAVFVAYISSWLLYGTGALI